MKNLVSILVAGFSLPTFAGPIISGGTGVIKIRCEGIDAKLKQYSVVIVSEGGSVSAGFDSLKSSPGAVPVIQMVPVDPGSASVYMGEGITITVDEKTMTGDFLATLPGWPRSGRFDGCQVF